MFSFLKKKISGDSTPTAGGDQPAASAPSAALPAEPAVTPAPAPSWRERLFKGLAKTRPGYADYVARTSGFIPWPPKKG